MTKNVQAINEHALLIKWQQGDERSFDVLFSLHFAKLHQFALRHTNHSGLAEELAMDAMLKVWMQKDALRPDVVSLAPLLFRILQSSLIDHYRKKKTELAAIDELKGEPESVEKADSKLLSEQIRMLYEEGMGRLTPKQKLVFEMRNNRQMTYKEIAAELSVSAKTVDRHLSDATNTIRDHVSKFLSIGIGVLTVYLLK